MPTGVFDDDGDTLEDKDGDAFDIDSIAGDGRITLDGVRPNRTFYIQLGDDRFNRQPSSTTAAWQLQANWLTTVCSEFN